MSDSWGIRLTCIGLGLFTWFLAVESVGVRVEQSVAGRAMFAVIGTIAVATGLLWEYTPLAS